MELAGGSSQNYPCLIKLNDFNVETYFCFNEIKPRTKEGPSLRVKQNGHKFALFCNN
jgi:hypothetical protein